MGPFQEAIHTGRNFMVYNHRLFGTAQRTKVGILAGTDSHPGECGHEDLAPIAPGSGMARPGAITGHGP